MARTFFVAFLASACSLAAQQLLNSSGTAYDYSVAQNLERELRAEISMIKQQSAQIDAGVEATDLTSTPSEHEPTKNNSQTAKSAIYSTTLNADIERIIENRVETAIAAIESRLKQSAISSSRFSNVGLGSAPTFEMAKVIALGNTPPDGIAEFERYVDIISRTPLTRELDVLALLSDDKWIEIGPQKKEALLLKAYEVARASGIEFSWSPQ